MDEILYNKMKEISSKKPLIGKQIFDVITSGMYEHPLIVYREYIQNSADSLDSLSEKQGFKVESRINIEIDGLSRCICIEDNGNGVANSDIGSVLVSIGASSKIGTERRGFRGIGRLGGLAYCEKLTFETRACAHEKVAIVEWDRKEFDKISLANEYDLDLFETILKVSKISFREATGSDGDNFFIVKMFDVHRFHKDDILNIKMVKDYLSQVAPVPYDPEFKFAEKIQQEIHDSLGTNTYNVYVNGTKIFRPYNETIFLSKKQIDKIKNIEIFKILGSDKEPLAIGWYAKTNYLASLPISTTMRGLRIRQGNIQIGNEYSLSDLFSERRFCTWHIGEVFIVGNKLKPNARRDWFENSLEFEKFLEQFSGLAIHLSLLCRRSSSERSLVAKASSALERLREISENESVFIDEEHFTKFVKKNRVDVENITNLKTMPETCSLLKEELSNAIKSIENNPPKAVFINELIDGRYLRKYDKKELIQEISKLILSRYHQCSTPEELIMKIIENFLKEKATDYSELKVV